MDRRLSTAAPVILALLLAIPTLGWPFLWDDFDLLGNAATFSPANFFPSADVLFYRPVSRGVYFSLLYHLGHASPAVAHLASAALLAALLILMVSTVRRLAGNRAGVISGLTLASSASIPIVVGWISAVQDLLAAVFVLAAVHLQLSRRTVPAAAAMACAILSKETAVAFVAVPILVSYFTDRHRPALAIRTALTEAVVVGVWAFVHPWIRTMGRQSAKIGTGQEQYVTLHGTGLLGSFADGLRLALNLPGGGSVEFPKHILPWAALATVMLVAVMMLERDSKSEKAAAVSLGGSETILAATGAWMFLCGILATSLVVHRWFSYYGLLPALGVSMLSGWVLRRQRPLVVAGVLVAFLWFGIGLRGSHVAPEDPSELNFREAAISMKRVEHGFKALHTQLPPQANAFVSVQTRGHAGLYRHLFRFQPLRIWYHQPGIWVLDPNRRRAGQGTDFLFWIDPDLEVYEINPLTLEPRGPQTTISLARYQKTLRGYAFGLASVGEVEFAVRILTTMQEPSRDVWVFDRRTAVALMLAAGRSADAARLSAGVPSFDHTGAVQAVTALLIEPISGLDLTVPAMTAFGLDPSDIETLRALMRALGSSHAEVGEANIAARIETLRPGDPEAAAVLQRARAPRPKEIVAPIPYDVPQ